MLCTLNKRHDFAACEFHHADLRNDKRRDPRVETERRSGEPPTEWAYHERNTSGGTESHTEYLYHPNVYKTEICSDFLDGICGRGKQCAFRHKGADGVDHDAEYSHTNAKYPWLQRKLSESKFDFASTFEAYLELMLRFKVKKCTRLCRGPEREACTGYHDDEYADQRVPPTREWLVLDGKSWLPAAVKCDPSFPKQYSYHPLLFRSEVRRQLH